MITNSDEAIEFAKNLMGASAVKLTEDGWAEVTKQAENELKWSYPISDQNKCYWMVERVRRHALYLLMVEAAHKFQYKQIHIEHRFKHYIQLIEKCDKDFLEAADMFPELFDMGTYSDFAFYLNPGFVYDKLGRDLTYIEE